MTGMKWCIVGIIAVGCLAVGTSWALEVNPSAAADVWDVEAEGISHAVVEAAQTYEITISGSVNYGGGTTVSEAYIYGAGSAYFGVVRPGNPLVVSNVTEIYSFFADNGAGDNSGSLTVSVEKVSDSSTQHITPSAASDVWDVEAEGIANAAVDAARSYQVTVAGSVSFGGGTTVTDVYVYGAGSAYFGVVRPDEPLVVSNVTELYAFFADNGAGDNSGSLTVTLDEVSTPLEEIDEVIAFFILAVEDETLTGVGPGKSTSNRLKAFLNMLLYARELIVAEEYDEANRQLMSVLKKADGEMRPPDFVTGSSAPTLANLLQELAAKL